MINWKETVPSEAILIQVDKMFCIDGYIVFWFDKPGTSGPERLRGWTFSHKHTELQIRMVLDCRFYVVQFYTVLCSNPVFLYDFL